MKIKQRQQGYTMVLFLAFITAILLAGFSLYDNGIVATERIRIQNTADATAYSTMTVLTRDMNFIAYTNRGMVANQVAIAQMVGLSSWIHMLDTSAQNLDTLAKATYIFPPVGVWINRVTNLIEQAVSASKKGIDKFTKAGVFGSEVINTALSGAQRAFQLATVDMAVATYEGIAKANDKDIKVASVGSGLAFVKLVKSWEDNVNYNRSTSTRKSNKNELKRFSEFAGVVSDPRDPFSSNRSHDWIKKTTIVDVGFSYVKISLEKKGGSDFIQAKTKNRTVQWQWTAMDTAGFWLHLKWPHRFHTHKSSREVVPVGWGAAHALNNNVKNKSNFNYAAYKNKKQPTYYNNGAHNSANKKTKQRNWGNGAWKNSVSAKLAYSYDKRNNLARTNGINAFYALKKDEQKDTGPSIFAALTKPSNALRVQETIDAGDGNYNRSKIMQIEEQGGIAGDSLYGLSKAETYFSRPRDLWARADNMREYGNLYNPFWQTRLIANSADEYAAVAVLQAVN